eukprot:gene22207-29270_t
MWWNSGVGRNTVKAAEAINKWEELCQQNELIGQIAWRKSVPVLENPGSDHDDLHQVPPSAEPSAVSLVSSPKRPGTVQSRVSTPTPRPDTSSSPTKLRYTSRLEWGHNFVSNTPSCARLGVQCGSEVSMAFGGINK